MQGSTRTPTQSDNDLSYPSTHISCHLPIHPHNEAVESLARQPLPVTQIGYPLPGVLNEAPVKIRYECARLAGHRSEILEHLTVEHVRRFEDYGNVRTWFSKQGIGWGDRDLLDVDRTMWVEADESFDDIVMAGHADLVFSGSDATIVNPCLEPLSLGRSCRFKRAFGGHRFLRLKLRLAQGNPFASQSKQHADQRSSTRQLLGSTMSLLGCQWQILRLQRDERKKGKEHRPVGAWTLDLFATEVGGLVPSLRQDFDRPNPLFFQRRKIPLVDALNWFISFPHNNDMLAIRAYARLDVGFSETTPTISFRPSQIRWVDNMYANGEAEHMEHADLKFTWDNTYDVGDPTVMNDGCARMSAAAGRQIADILGLDGSVPSVFQARLGCFKGLWIVEGASECQAESDLNEVWIEVTPAQKKFNPHPSDLDDSTYDPRRTMFEVVNSSARLRPACMSHTILPVLVDRGVDESRLADLYRGTMRREKAVFLDALKRPEKLHQWISSGCKEGDDCSQNYLGSLPLTKEGAALFLLEHGFEPQSNPYLADIAIQLAIKRFASPTSAINLRLTSSVNAYGAADLRRCLAPGHIHLSFSTVYVDEGRGPSYSFLNDMDVLVGRHPIIRPSDVQRVRAVFRPELAHIRDVVVFPTRGVMPLAGKMSNGDYDGDRFWICWHPELVQNFRNAPAPEQLPEPLTVGISRDDRTLDQLLGNRSARTSEFAKLNMEFRCQEALKGYSRSCYDTYVYSMGSFHSAEATLLADIHEMLMDGDKKGYSMGFDTFNSQLRKRKLRPCSSTLRPLYKDLLNGSGNTRHRTDLTPRNVIDRLMLDVLDPLCSSIRCVLGREHRMALSADNMALRESRARFEHTWNQNQTLAQEVLNVKKELRKIHDNWQDIWSKIGSQSSTRSTSSSSEIECLCDRFRSLCPAEAQTLLSSTHADQMSRAPTDWDLLKGLVVWHEYGSTAFTYRMAGSELAHLKAWNAVTRPRSIVPGMHSHLISRARRRRCKPPPTACQSVNDDDRDDAFTESGTLSV